MSACRVLVTLSAPRPIEEALVAAGFVVEAVSLLAFEATGRPPPAVPGALLVTSAHAAALLSAGAAPVIAVGEHTAAALRAAGHRVDAVAAGDGASALGLLSSRAHPRPWVFAGAEEPAPALAAALAAGDLLHWPLYRTAANPAAAARIRALPAPDAVVLGSPKAAAALVGAGLTPHAALVAIGPTTAAALAALGRPAAAVAAAPTPPALSDAVRAALSRRSASSSPS